MRSGLHGAIFVFLSLDESPDLLLFPIFASVYRVHKEGQ